MLAVVTAAGCAHTPGGGGAVLDPARGAVAVQLVGTREVKSTRVEGTGFSALVVRMIVDNRSAEPWTVRPEEQVAQVGEWGTQLPADASAGALVVAPGEQRRIDLFYPMPRPQFGPEMARHLTIEWRVRTPDGTVGEHVDLDGQLAELRRVTM
jgi:hypothetical protein